MPKQPIKKYKSTVILESSLSDRAGPAVSPSRQRSSDPTSAWGQIEDAFFERGIAEENAAIEQYASLSAKGWKEPKTHSIRSFQLLWAGCGLIFLVASVMIVSRLRHRSEEIAVTPTLPSSVTTVAVAAAVGHPEDPGWLPMMADASPKEDSASDVFANEVSSAEVPRAAEPISEVPSPKPESVAVANGASKPGSGDVVHTAIKLDPITGALAADEGEALACRRGLEKKQGKIINETCIKAFAHDSSLVSPLMKWTRGEFERGHTALAVAWANRIVEIDPNQAEAYMIIGMAEQTAHHFTEARMAYKRYLELAPKGAFARDVRSALMMM